MTIIVQPKFNFEEFLKSIVRHRITHLWSVTILIHITKSHQARQGCTTDVGPSLQGENSRMSLGQHSSRGMQHSITKNYDLNHVRATMSGAAPLSNEVVRQLHQVVPNASVRQGYGTIYMVGAENLL